MNTGSILAGRPFGSLTTYGLGSANDNLPTFVVLTDAAEVLGGPKNWSSGFFRRLSGTQFRNDGTPSSPRTAGTISEQQRSKLTSDSLEPALRTNEDSDLEARTQSYELAYRMQSAARKPWSFPKKNEPTRQLYGPARQRAVSAQLPVTAACWSVVFVSSSSPAVAVAGCTRLERQSPKMPDFRPANRRPADGFEGAWAARDDAGGLGGASLAAWFGEKGKGRITIRDLRSGWREAA
jgi:hypothetical protein